MKHYDLTDNLAQQLNIMIREKDIPYFGLDELIFYYNKCGGNLEFTAYTCLLIKAEDTSLSISGLTTTDTSKYLRRIANMYRPSNSGTLRGG